MEPISTKFSNVETDMLSILTPLKNNQTFLRMIKYLSNYPLEQQTYDTVKNVVVSQPDLPVPYDLTGDSTGGRLILLTLFNQNIVTEAKVYIFFSHLDFSSNESQSIIANHDYVMDILIPYQNVQMDDKLRNIRIVDEIMKSVDNQYIAGFNQVFIKKGKDYILNANYQGVTLYFSVQNPRV